MHVLPEAGSAIPEGASRGCVAETLPRAGHGRQTDGGVSHPRSRVSEKVPEGQADALPVNAGLTGNAVDVVALTCPSHHEKGAVSQRELVPAPILFPPRLDDQSPPRAERCAGAEGNAPLDGRASDAGARALTRRPRRPARTPGRSARPLARSPPRRSAARPRVASDRGRRGAR